MHIPGGLVSDPVCMLTTVASSSALGLGLWKVSRPANRCGGQSLATVGALVFAVQMVNFPVDPGRSGHLIGGALAAALLGPWGAMWAMASILATQAFVFGDGGIATLGANLLSMAVAAPWTAWLSYRGLAYCGLADRDWRLDPTGPDAQISSRDALCWGLASFVSVLAAATVCSLVLACGDAAPVGRVLPAMLLAHLPVGLVEGTATAAVVLLTGRQFVLAPRMLLALAAGVVAVLAPFASGAPDGLERVAERLGFAGLATSGFAGLLPDYALPGVDWAPLAVALAGLVGVAVVSAAGHLVGRTVAGAWKSR